MRQFLADHPMAADSARAHQARSAATSAPDSSALTSQNIDTIVPMTATAQATRRETRALGESALRIC
jgi:hypothetical protein